MEEYNNVIHKGYSIQVSYGKYNESYKWFYLCNDEEVNGYPSYITWEDEEVTCEECKKKLKS